MVIFSDPATTIWKCIPKKEFSEMAKALCTKMILVALCKIAKNCKQGKYAMIEKV